MSIRLSEKHGVNPSLAICFFCGKDTGEIILPGRLPGDAEAPRRAVWGYEPCPQCAQFMGQGVILISVRAEERNPDRTGGWVVVTDDFITRALTPEAAGSILKARVAFVSDAAWDKLGLPRGAAS
jgi:hypothetical protein